MAWYGSRDERRAGRRALRVGPRALVSQRVVGAQPRDREVVQAHAGAPRRNRAAAHAGARDRQLPRHCAGAARPRRAPRPRDDLDRHRSARGGGHPRTAARDRRTAASRSCSRRRGRGVDVPDPHTIEGALERSLARTPRKRADEVRLFIERFIEELQADHPPTTAASSRARANGKAKSHRPRARGRTGHPLTRPRT